MATVQQILNYIEALAPPDLAEDWDNVGLLCGHREKQVRKILMALDPFLHVCQEAAEIGADLIVTHHPMIFRPLKAVSDSSEPGACALTLIENGIAAINAHTNLDMANGGVNDILAQTLKLSDVEIINPVGTDAQGNLCGLLRKGTVVPMELHVFLEYVKSALGTPVIRYADGGKPVHLVAVGGGACGSEMMDAIAAGCDTFVTADLKYNQFWDARYLGLNLIDAGHFYTENPVIPALAEKLKQAFPDIEIKISKKHTDCMKFF